jgi:hypothetical protein
VDHGIRIALDYCGGKEGDKVTAAVRGEYFAFCSSDTEGANLFHLQKKIFTGLSWKLIGLLGEQPVDISALGISADHLEEGADAYVRITVGDDAHAGLTVDGDVLQHGIDGVFNQDGRAVVEGVPCVKFHAGKVPMRVLEGKTPAEIMNDAQDDALRQAAGEAFTMLSDTERENAAIIAGDCLRNLQIQRLQQEINAMTELMKTAQSPQQRSDALKEVSALSKELARLKQQGR